MRHLENPFSRDHEGAGLGPGQAVVLWFLSVSAECLLVAIPPGRGWDAQAWSRAGEGMGMLVAAFAGLRVAKVPWGVACGPPAGGWRAAVGQGGIAFLLHLAFLFPVVLTLGPASGLEPAASGPELTASALFGALLVAPVAEEILYRGVLQPALTVRCGRLAGILVPSLLFGLSHPGVSGFLLATLFGLLCGLLSDRTGSLLPCMGLHAANNAMVVLAASNLPFLSYWLGMILVLTLWGLAGERGYLRVRKTVPGGAEPRGGLIH